VTKLWLGGTFDDFMFRRDIVFEVGDAGKTCCNTPCPNCSPTV
jgi:hypothetical protein